MTRFLLFVFILFSSLAFSQNIEEAKQKLAEAPDDSARVRKLNRLAYEFLAVDVDSAQFYLNQSLELANKIGYKKGVAFYHLVNGIILSEHLDKPAEAIENYYDAIDIYKEIKAPIYMPDCFNNIGNIYLSKLENTTKAIEHFRKAIDIDRENGTIEVIPQRLYNVGSVFEQEEKFDSALVYYKNGLDLAIETNNQHGTYLNYLGLGGVYLKTGDTDKGIHFSEQALAYAKQLNNNDFIGNAHFTIGSQYFSIKRYPEAIYHLESSLKVYESINSDHSRLQTLEMLAEAALKAEQFEKSSNYYFELTALADSSNIIEINKVIEDIQTKYDVAENKRKIEILEKDKELKSIQTWILLIALISAIAIIFLVIKQVRLIKASRLRMIEKNKVIRTQFGEIHEKNLQITDSITYAQRIQKAILKPSLFKSVFKDSFIFFQPKDIVSGDFYWIHETPTDIFFAVADCTGHGVPGAFMSIISSNLLERAVMIRNISQPNEVLSDVNNELILQLKSNQHQTNDGMDIVFCRYDKSSKKLSFSGAHNGLYHFRDGHLEQYKGDQIFIGKNNITPEAFQLIELDIQEGDEIFLFSDGFADQKGGPKNKKFFYAPFRELLTSVAHENCAEQKKIVAEAFNTWKADQDQFDDVCVVGLKF